MVTDSQDVCYIARVWNQVKELMSEGIEVMFVTCVAVGVGRQKLRHQRMMNSR